MKPVSPDIIHSAPIVPNLNKIADSVPALIAYIDSGQHYRYANDTYTRWFSYTKNEIIGRHVKDVLGEAAYQKLQKKIETVLTGTEVIFEDEIPYKKGEVRYVRVSYTPDKDEEGVVQGFAVLVIDVSEEKKLEEDRKKAESRLQFLNQASEQLASTLDYNLALEKISKLAVPHIADWFAIDILNEKNDLKWLVIAHKDAEKVAWAIDYRKKYPVDLNDEESVVGRVVRRGEAELYTQISNDQIKKNSRDEVHHKQLSEIGFTSMMIVPLKVGGKVFGTITFATTKESNIQYDESDLEFGKDFAGRVAVTLENVSLYKEVKTKEERLELAQKSAKVATFDWNIPERISKWSSNVHELYGLQEGTFTGEISEWVPYIHPEDREELQKNIEASFETGKYASEFRVIWNDKSIHWLLGQGTVMYDDNSKPIRMVGINMDITERKQAEEAIKQRNKQLEILNSIGKTISAELDLQKILQAVTDATTQLSGAEFGAFFYNVVNTQGESYMLYTLAGAPMQKFSEFGMPRNTAVFHPTFSGAGVVRSDDIRQDPRYGKNAPHYGIPAGHLPVVSYLAVPVVSSSGEVLGGLFFGHSRPGVFTENSEELVVGVASQAAIAIDNARLYEAKNSSEERFRIMAESIPQIVWTANSNGETDYFNQQWYNYTNLTAEETKHGWSTVVHPDDKLNLDERWRYAVETGEDYQVEARLLRHFEHVYRWHLIRALPVKNKQGKITKWFGTSTDIEDQKKADEKKDEFIGIASHELKTPLTSIRAYIQLVERTLDNNCAPETKLYLEKSNIYINRLSDLISELLDVSRIQAGKLQFNKTVFDFEAFVTETLANIQHTASTHIICISGNAKAKIRGDKERLEQVLSNFISNAIKYSPDSNKILVHLTREKTQVKVSITDFGIGIPKDKIIRLFDRFYRVEDSAHRFQGLGIGLYISNEIIKRHNGTVGVESQVGKGSTFYFVLPVSE